jgi:hypothetical protein
MKGYLMPNKDYLPRTDADFVVWLQSFSSKLPANAATLGITPAEVTQFTNDAADAANKLTDLQNTKTALQSLTQSKGILFADIEKRVRDKAVIIKRNPNYTSVIGEDLGVVPAATGLGKSISIDSQKPAFETSILPDMVRLDWVKGEFDGVVIQSKRAAETAFAFLEKDTRSPYEDTRHNITSDVHEPRFYRMRYLLKDQEVGQWSDELKVYCIL